MKKILVTGGSRGIGRAISMLLKKEWIVVTPSRNEMDLSAVSSIDRYFEGNNDFDAIVNNAGINIIKNISDISMDDISLINKINLEAPLRIVQHCIPHMKKKRFGRIVNISSIWGVRSKEMRTLYSATKFGLIGQTKALARELGEYGILINSVCPGFTNTKLTAQSLTSQQLADLENEIPLHRLAAPDEIAHFVDFLVSNKNTYITGQALTIDGGYTA